MKAPSLPRLFEDAEPIEEDSPAATLLAEHQLPGPYPPDLRFAEALPNPGRAGGTRPGLVAQLRDQQGDPDGTLVYLLPRRQGGPCIVLRHGGRNGATIRLAQPDEQHSRLFLVSDLWSGLAGLRSSPPLPAWVVADDNFLAALEGVPRSLRYLGLVPSTATRSIWAAEAAAKVMREEHSRDCMVFRTDRVLRLDQSIGERAA